MDLERNNDGSPESLDEAVKETKMRSIIGQIRCPQLRPDGMGGYLPEDVEIWNRWQDEEIERAIKEQIGTQGTPELDSYAIWMGTEEEVLGPRCVGVHHYSDGRKLRAYEDGTFETCYQTPISD